MEIRFAMPRDIPRIYDGNALLSLLSDKNRPIFVATEENNVLGYGFCIRKACQNDPGMTDHNTLYIDDLRVDETCRGRHIGHALYERIWDYARKEGFQSVTLNV